MIGFRRGAIGLRRAPPQKAQSMDYVGRWVKYGLGKSLA